MMRAALIVALTLVVAYLAYAGLRFFVTVQTSKKLIHAAVPFQKEGSEENAILVLGDSTAVGVGADRPEETVAGRVAAYLDATSVENYSVSGAKTEDLRAQIAKAKLDQYRLIVIQIGGNDIIRFRSAEKATQNLREAIKLLPSAERIVLISAGDVGGATLFPLPVRPFHTQLNKAYHEAFARLAEETGITYVNFRNAPATDEINAHPEIYLAKDGLHPSSEGYRLWFETMRPSL